MMVKNLSNSEDEGSSSSSSIVDLHSIDLESQNFKTLPTKEKYDLLLELKETRKMNSWGKLHELPKKSDNFSDFQTEKEMGDAGMSLNELESLLNEEGIDTKIETLPTRRIASNNSTRYLLINDVKQALADAKKKIEENVASTSKDNGETTNTGNAKKDELEDDLEKAIKMSLECTNEADTTANNSKTDDSWTSYMSDSESGSKTDSEDGEGCEAPDMTSAKAYIMQYCDFTNKFIDNIVSSRNKSTKSKKKSKVDEILEDMNMKRSQMVDNGAHLSSSDDECSHNNSESDVVEVNTSSALDAMPVNVDTTEASIVVLENPSQDVITLDSSIEESPEKVINFKETHSENQGESSDDDFEDVPVIDNRPVVDLTLNVNEDPEDDIQMTNGENQGESSDDYFKDVPQIEHRLGKITSPERSNNQNDEESDSTDDDFEDVPEINNKPVVELTLNVNEAPEDDIFADIFTEQAQANIPNQIAVALKIDSKTKQGHAIIHEQDDDELQKAIMMSLECVAEDNIPVANVREYEAIPKDDVMGIKKPEKGKELQTDTSSKEKSITVESLNEILSAESSKQSNIVIQRDCKETSPKQSEDKANVPISTEQLNNMVEEIQSEEQGLEQEKGRLDRIGRNITEQMTKEAQELLQIFGIPYIVAPMEAEAQCAFLESVNLTDGTITDDSDIWLFGGRTVYKNFFNQKKHVLQFLAERIEKSFNLSREQLVLLALLVGSDYTTGVDGIGPVTALEILASFPFNKRKLSEASKQARYTQVTTGLQEFKQWVRGGKRTDNTSLKKKLRNISLNDEFPSVRVVQAYLEPNIEQSEDKFSWGELDITVLRDYTKAKFGWSQNKLDEIIKPVLKRMVERKSQKSMQDYFKKKINFQSLEDQMSKRVKAAVQRMGPELPIEEAQSIASETKHKAKRKINKGKESVVGPSKAKNKRTDDSVLKTLSVKVVSEVKDGKSEFDIKINKTDRFQEIIPQREKDKQSLFQNKMKAIELFRRTNIDKRKKITKRKPLLPKDRAELSESSDSN
ncbi:DNA-repair protein complementing XP-G cells [Operophtera brumata]|uniref:DNA-repair protein complementing XP-G cells n=1 Tax=Operophtera brumata TaxID=104452 RepID=A0A0L7KXA7_OPEBR|nr:DNA-repair protein complementing XP-G cells [Operophtera brumata]